MNHVSEQCVVILYRFISAKMGMTMPMNEKSDDVVFDEIFVSSNFVTVFCTQHELDEYLSLLTLSGMPRGMSIVFTKKKLNRKYTKKEIMNAMPEQIKGMIELVGHLIH